MKGLLLSVAATVVACSGDIAGPNRGDPAQYAFATDVSFSCGSWYPFVPSVELGLFDVTFGVQGPRPTEASLRRVVERGGTVVHRFHLNRARVIMAPAAVASLAAVSVAGVRDATDYTVQLAFGLSGQHVPALFASDLGKIIWMSSSAPFSVFAEMDDAVVPTLRADPTVTYVESGGGVACLE